MIKRLMVATGALLLTACGGGGDGAGTSASSSANSAASFLYIPSGDDKIAAYKINEDSGELTAVSGSPFATAKAPTILSADRTGHFIYSLGTDNGVSPTISGFELNSTTGALSATPNSPYAAGTNGIFFSPLVFHPFLDVALGSNWGDGQIYGYKQNPVTGELTSLPSATFPGGLIDGAFAKNGFYYLPSSATTIDVYKFSAATGVPTKASTASSIKPPGNVVSDPSGKYVFTSYNSSDSAGFISMFGISPITGALAEVAGSPFSTGDSSLPFVGSFGSSGKFLYVIDVAGYLYFPAQVNKIRSFVVDADKGAISEIGTPLEFGAEPLLLADITHSENFFIVVTVTGIHVAAINPGTGELTEVPGSPFATAIPNGSFAGAALDSLSKYLYVTDTGTQSVHVFSVNQDTGSIAELGSYPVSVPIPTWAPIAPLIVRVQ